MSERYPRIEIGDTRQLTITYSAAPTGSVEYWVRAGSAFNALVGSGTATASSTTAFYAFHTFSGYIGLHAWEFITSYTSVGPVIERGIVDVYATNTW